MAKNYDTNKCFARLPKVCTLSEFITALFFLVRVWALYSRRSKSNPIELNFNRTQSNSIELNRTQSVD